MNSLFIVMFAAAAFILAYFLYGKSISRWIGVDPGRKTPAHTMNDGVDYVPARKQILLGHHFASIAGAAPIIGPIVAVSYGWVPVLLWIIIGGIFIGSVHDFTSMVASVRHRGGSIGEIIERQIGPRGKFFFLIFSWSTLVLVVAVFTDIVSKTLAAVPETATGSVLFMFIAVIFGILLYRFRLPLWMLTIFGVILMAAALYAGYSHPVSLSRTTWAWILFGYIFLASILPVWLLLQPRDYLNSFILYALIILAFLGIIIVRPSMNIPAFTSFSVKGLGSVFPILFVTVACGAVSGFHSLVASGTSAKQISSEADARFVGFGGMLIESMLAVISLVIAGMFIAADFGKLSANPVELFATGFASMMNTFGADARLAKTFASLAISAFALTSLDTATRLARYAFEEFFSRGDKPARTILVNRYSATCVSVFLAGALVLTGKGLSIWPVFGSANQLLAALALLAVSVWLSRSGRRSFFTVIPMIFMFVMTLTALALMTVSNMRSAHYLLAGVSVILLLLALFLAMEAARKLYGKGSPSMGGEAAPAE
jgi:carbon starvation protein